MIETVAVWFCEISGKRSAVLADLFTFAAVACDSYLCMNLELLEVHTHSLSASSSGKLDINRM